MSATKRLLEDPGVREHAVRPGRVLRGRCRRWPTSSSRRPASSSRRFVRLLRHYWAVGLRAGVGRRSILGWLQLSPKRANASQARRLLVPDRRFAAAADRSGPARDPPGPSARTHGRDRTGSEARPRPERFRMAARPVELRPALAGDDRVPSALRACRGKARLPRRRCSTSSARSPTTPPARAQADRHRRSFDAGARAADRNQRGRPLQAPRPACPGGPGRAAPAGLLRAVHALLGTHREPLAGRARVPRARCLTSRR